MTRTADLFWCALTAPLLLPLCLLLGVAIWLDDGRPLFFHQERAGRSRVGFTIYKFRTMRENRVTRIGAWLRRSGLDETPQWFNVLVGEMSWIGPRPLTPTDLERLGWDQPQHDPRFSIRPGITGLAQLLAGVNGGWTRGVDRIYRMRRGWSLNTRIVVLSVMICVVGKQRVRWVLHRPHSRRGQ